MRARVVESTREVSLGRDPGYRLRSVNMAVLVGLLAGRAVWYSGAGCFVILCVLQACKSG